MKIFLFLLSFAFSLLLTGQEYPAATIPLPLLLQADEVVREEQYELEVRSESQGIIRHRKVTTLLNDNSTANTFVLGYDADTRIKKLEAYLYDASGREIRKLDKGEIADYAAVDGYSIYQDNRIKVVDAHYSEYPYTVAVEYEMVASGINFAVFPVWQIQDYRQSVELAQMAIRLPPGLPLHYQLRNFDQEPQVVDSGKEQTYSWEVRNLPALPREPFSPSPYDILPRVLTAPGRFQIEGYQGSMSDWQSYGAFVHLLYQGRDVLPEAVKADVQQIVAGASSEAEKVRRLYGYLQENMRYVSVQLGIGGWQPFDANYVSENKYGDCKALSNYMIALLNEAGIEAYPVLIQSGKLPYEVEEDFTIPYFNHVIAYVPAEDLWLECTSNNYPPGYIGASNSGRNVLLVTPEGGRIARTPSLSADENTTTGKTEITLAPDGSAHVRGQLTASGARHEMMRYRSAFSSQQEIQEWFLKQSTLPSLGLQSLEIEAAEEAPVAQCRYEGQMRHYASRAGKRLFIPLNAVRPLKDIPPKEDVRRYPVELRDAFTETDTILIHLPEGFRMESLSEDPIVVESSFGKYEAWVIQKGRTLIYTRRLQLKRERLPATEYEAFRAFFQQLGKADAAMAVLVEDKA